MWITYGLFLTPTCNASLRTRRPVTMGSDICDVRKVGVDVSHDLRQVLYCIRGKVMSDYELPNGTVLLNPVITSLG